MCGTRGTERIPPPFPCVPDNRKKENRRHELPPPSRFRALGAACLALAVFALSAPNASAKWIWDASAGTLTADGSGLTPAGTALKGGTTAGNWGRNIVGGQVQLTGVSVAASVVDLTEPIETADGTAKTLESIADRTFNGNTTVEAVFLPDSVKWIGQQAFNGCTSLKDIGHLPSQLYQLGGGAFNGCTSLTNEIVIPAGFRGSTWNSFNNTQVTGDIVWPANAGDVQVLDWAGTRITSFTIVEGANCKMIRRQAFQNCTSLTNVVLNEGLTTIGEGSYGQSDAWHGCTKLVPFPIPSTVTDIGHNAFYDCKSFTGEFVWPEQVPVLTANCFNGSGISSFVAKTGLREIRQQVFQNCANLTTVVLPDTLETMSQPSWAQSIVGLTVYWRACPANALTGGLYVDWGSGKNRTHYFSATPENVAAWTAYAESDLVNDGTNYKTFLLPGLLANGNPDYGAVGTAGQEGGKIYWWKDPDLLPPPTIVMVK